MEEGDVNGAIKVITNNMSGGVLPLNDETLKTLAQKHPEESPLPEDMILQGPCQKINDVIFDVIDESLIIKAAKNTKGGSGPSGMDADGWRKPLASKVYGDSGRDLRKALASVIKRLCTSKEENESLSAFLACRLVPLDKCPGLRPIGVGEVLRRIAGKVVMLVMREDVLKSYATVQMCAGHRAGCEAAIHAMRDVFEQEHAEAALLVDAANAFNSVNRKAMMHNIEIICPIIATYVNNCYRYPARLFIVGGKELKSREGTTQGDPLGMAIYAIAITPLLNLMMNVMVQHEKTGSIVAFADDLTAVGRFASLRKWWDALLDVGPKLGYNPQPIKSWLIVKDSKVAEAKHHFQGTRIQITTSGERHLGAVIGSEEYKKEYCGKIVQKWMKELALLSEIAVIEPQAAYTCYISGYQSKYTYLLRTVPDISDELRPLEDIIRHRFLPAITGGHMISDNERILLSLPPKYGGMGIKLIHEEADIDYQNSRTITASLCDLTAGKQSTDSKASKQQIKNDRAQRHKAKLELARSEMNDAEKRLNDSNQEKGTYNWLTTLPIKEYGYDLNKEQFWDAVRIRYNWVIPKLPSDCACGNKFTLMHALSCKKGGFISLRHNDVRNVTAQLLSEVCHDVKVEPMLIKLDGEGLQERTANTSDEARLDVSARSFWIPGQRVFCDVRVFDLNAQRYRNSDIKRCFQRNEEEKKKKYNERVLQVENASFTPLVFSANGGMGRECHKFYQRLAEMIVDKRDIPSSIATNYIRTKISFSLLRSMLLCLRGSRSLKRLPLPIISDEDMVLVNHSSEIREI